jgi:hypothetical protein
VGARGQGLIVTASNPDHGSTRKHKPKQPKLKAGFGQLTNGCAGDAASTFATCGYAVALALGSKRSDCSKW